MAMGFHDDGPMIGRMYNGYSDAVAHRAVPTPSANGNHTDIARGMGATSVNPQKAASAVGRGPIPQKIGESAHHFIGYLQEIGVTNGNKTSDAHRVQ